MTQAALVNDDPEEEVREKAERFVEHVEGFLEDPRDFSFSFNFDVNGPLADNDAGLTPRDGVVEELEEMRTTEDSILALLSGHPVTNLRDFKDDIGIDEFLLIGELGSVWEEEEVNQVEGESSQDLVENSYELFEIYQDLYRKAAEENAKMLVEPNISNVKANVRFEAESEERSGIGYERADHSIEEIFENLEPYSREGKEFSYREDEDMVVFRNSLRNATILSTLLQEEFGYAGLRYKELEDGKIGFFRDPEDREDFELEDSHRMIREALQSEHDAETTEYEDWCTDIVTDKGVSKEKGAFEVAREQLEPPVIVTHVGDRETDYLEDHYSVNFPLKGTEAYERSEDTYRRDIPVEDGLEYIKILDEVSRMWRERHGA